MLKKYQITIEEMISDTFEVFAENDKEAKKIAEEKYYNSEFVLTPGYLVAKQMQICDLTDDFYTEWIEF